MKKTTSTILGLLMVMLIGLFLTGCNSNGGSKTEGICGEEPTAVCIVVGKHANAPEISTTRFYDLVYEAAYTYGSVSAVSVEGEPKMLCDYKVNPPKKHVDSAKRRQIAADNAQAILAEIANAEASTPEADTLTALSMSSDILKSKTESVKLLCIDDSFLSTAGLLNFAASNLMEQEPSVIVEQLNARFAIPDLSGVDVTVLGMAQTCGSQGQLPSEYRHKLEAIWTAVFDAADCDNLSFDCTPLGDTEPENALHVSTVTVITDVLTFIAPEDVKADEPAPASEKQIPEVVRIDETTIKFVGNSDAFVDSKLAVQALEPIARLLHDNPDVNVVLAGSTASVGGDGIDLSLMRAEAVKGLLVSAGVNESQIRCVGLGRADHCLRVDDLDPNGNLIEDLAKLNRAVFLFAEGSDTAQKLNIQ